MKKILASVAGICSLAFAPPKKDPPPPNVVIIFMDDMGYGDPECFGGGPYHTPNINRLAASGMRLTNFYVAQPVCTASRSAILTGCYPTRIGIHGAINDRSNFALNPAEETLAELLKTRGYHTGIIGKWHLGSRPPFMPLQQGFDEYFGLPYSNDMWPVWYDGKPADSTRSQHKFPPLPLYDGATVDRIIKTPADQDQLTTWYTQRAVRFIGENKNKPFFLYLAHSMVHVPLGVSPRFRGKSGAGLFGDVMEEVDWSVGEVMGALEKNGLADNTIVIFTSDNGPWLSFGNHAGNSGGLREGKGTTWDGGLKVPFIIRWPEKVPAGTVRNNMVVSFDLLPTLVDLCKAPRPARKIDGVNVWEVFRGNPDAHPRDELAYYYDVNNLKAIRKGEWKLNLPCVGQTYGNPGAIGRDGFPGRTGRDSIRLALYNLSRDPGEDRDVKDMYPEVVKQLLAIAEKYRAMLGDGITGRVGSEVRPAAEIK